ncbi:hypothetical protein MMC06_002036 [Schaereria dolodes]|nr:hypothetical protein [Schaereria dolodes]
MGAYSPPSPAGHSPDTTSPIYPDRAIRPLPKRRLRSRLSPEMVNSILYRPARTEDKPLSDIPYYGMGLPAHMGLADIDKGLMAARLACNGDNKHNYRFKGREADSDDEEGLGIIRRYEEQRRLTDAMPTRLATNGSGRPELARVSNGALSQSTISSNDSVDGYDSFENTNNKKKRKIPTSGSLGNHHSSLSAEMANMGISAAVDMDPLQGDSDSSVGHYYGSGHSAIPNSSNGTGISGAGRGRYGRSSGRGAGGRSPLGVSMNGSNAWQAGRAGTQRRDYTLIDGFGEKGNGENEYTSTTRETNGRYIDHAPDLTSDQGIISAAIANAAAIPASTSKGQENISLLDQQPTKKAASAKTQFTFTCESDSTKGMVWPGSGLNTATANTPYLPSAPPNMPVTQPGQNLKGFSTQGTQTSPTMAGQVNQNGQQVGANQAAPQQPRKPRRPPGKLYALAARQRRLQQEYNNYHHPPKVEDVWVCEFCEYESIFGSPPEALVRQYEIKDRQERKRLAEKQRLLEKAKMKGRKGKKGNKNASKNTNAAAQPQQPAGQQNHSQQQPGQVPVQNHGTQSEDYQDDDYIDDPVDFQVPPQIPTKIPQPIAQQFNTSPRSANGNVAANTGGNRVGLAP